MDLSAQRTNDHQRWKVYWKPFCYSLPMNSEAQWIIDQLGDDVVAAILEGRRVATEGLQQFKVSNPKLFRALSPASLHGNIHDWFFDGVRDAVAESGRAKTLSTNATGDCLVVDDKFVIMFKKHDSQHRVKSYSTRAARRFHSGLVTFSEMRMTSLTAGYLFDDDLNEIGTAVISYRHGLRRKPLWCYKIESDAASAAGYALNPVVEPPVPLIEIEPLRRAAEGTKDE